MNQQRKSPSAQELIDEWKEIAADRNLPAVSSYCAHLRTAESLPADSQIPPKASEQQRIREHLVKSLSVAVQLEFATIPPYLCALWSIKDELHPVSHSIREIIQEEMLHMGLACNMLVAVGGTPEIREWAPQYPTENGLPGGLHQGLEVKLQGLNDSALDDFLRIESPAELSDVVDHEKGDPDWTDTETIGEFYGTIKNAFEYYAGDFDVSRQISASLVWLVVASRKDASRAIDLITQQGEGAPLFENAEPRGPRDSSQDDYAHYYRFLEIRKRKKLVPGKKRGKPQVKYIWQGELAHPDIYEMGPVPTGGFSNVPDQHVNKLLTDFDRTYTEMLTLLERSWQEPEVGSTQPTGQGSLVHAIAKMFDLEQYAKPLMQIPRHDDPEGKLTYGPQFRVTVREPSIGGPPSP